MPTITEALAAKKAAADAAGAPPPAHAEQPARAAAPIVLKETLRERVEIDAIDTRLAMGKSPAAATRALATTTGELMDMTPAHADPQTAAWHEAMAGLESDLCIMRDNDQPETCWLALRSNTRPPLLLHRLPWLLWDHPAAQRPESEPY